MKFFKSIEAVVGSVNKISKLPKLTYVCMFSFLALSPKLLQGIRGLGVGDDDDVHDDDGDKNAWKGVGGDV